MICKKCGAQIEDTSAECKFCGAAYEITEPIKEENKEAVPPAEEIPGVDNGDSDTDVLFDENEIKRQRQIERMRAEKQSQLDEIEKRRKEKKIKQRRTRVLVVLIAVICLGAAAFGGYYLFNSDFTEPEVIVATQTPEASELPAETATPEPSPSPSPAPSETPSPTEGPSWQATGESASNNSSGNGSSQTASNAVIATQAPKVTQKPAAVQKPVSTAKPSAPVSKPAASAGLSNDRFNAALVTGGEVVKAGDKTYMSFKYNGSTYYAKVSANTTTNFIAGKAMTISAYKVSETYNGANVYAITAITHYNGNYVFPSSGYKALTEADLAGKSDWELRVGRNEIYARHGRKFKDSALQNYFNGCSWYKVKSSYDYSNDANNLNAVERANAAFIKKYEDTH